MKPVKPRNIDEYIATLPEEIQARMKRIRKKMKAIFPDAVETIRYGMPAFEINAVHIYFSAYKKHIGMYPMYGMEEFDLDLEPYRGKGTKDSLHFPHDKPLPMELIEKIVRFKVAKGK